MTAKARRRFLTVFTPVYNEEAALQRCYDEVRRVCESLSDRYDYEHVFGDNRSTDRTFEMLKELAAKDPRVRVLRYARNFGAEKSSFTLMRHAAGDLVVGLTVDLQEPPSMIPAMVALWEQGNQVVYGVYRNPHEGVIMRALRGIYYRLIDKLSPDPLPRDFTGFALLDRRVVDEIVRVDDHAPYLRGLIATAGFKQVAFPYERAPRTAGRSKHGFGFLFDFGLNGIVSHSIVPIRVASWAGATLALGSMSVSAVYGVLLILRWLGAIQWAIQAPAAASLLVLVPFFAGVQLMFLGILGEYVGAIHGQVRRKPFVIVEERINFPKRRRRRSSVPEPALQDDERAELRGAPASDAAPEPPLVDPERDDATAP